MDSHSPTEPPLSPDVVVLMVPLPAQGHLNQLLHLSRLICNRGLSIHFASSATHNRQAKVRLHGWDLLTATNLHFHDLPFPSVPTPPTNPSSPLKFPAHLHPTFEAAIVHLRTPLVSLLRSLSYTARRVVIVHDSLMSFIAEEAAGIHNAEAYVFHPASAFTSFFYKMDSFPNPLEKSPKTLNLSYYASPSMSTDGCFTERILELGQSQSELMRFDSGQLYNSCHPIEGEFLEYLGEPDFVGRSGGARLWAVGPLNPVTVGEGRGRRRHECMEWLDMQPPRSVVYVSFGTMSSISDEQILEVAAGLRQSGQRFIWVLRDADRGDIFSEEGKRYDLPDNYEEMIKGVGMVVRDWAPQIEILAHNSTGGFMSHCGWNSSMEGLSMGVPIVAWPMASDQPRNAMLLTEVLRVGVAVRQWDEWDKVVPSTAIESAVRHLMESDEGKEIRKRAEELGVASPVMEPTVALRSKTFNFLSNSTIEALRKISQSTIREKSTTVEIKEINETYNVEDMVSQESSTHDTEVTCNARNNNSYYWRMTRVGQ